LPENTAFRRLHYNHAILTGGLDTIKLAAGPGRVRRPTPGDRRWNASGAPFAPRPAPIRYTGCSSRNSRFSVTSVTIVPGCENNSRRRRHKSPSGLDA
jgi:hypothetical protein